MTLEELAARMDKMEQKLAKYEERFGPLEEGRGVVATPQPANQPSVASSPKGVIPVASDAAAIDASYGLGAGDFGGCKFWERIVLV